MRLPSAPPLRGHALRALIAAAEAPAAGSLVYSLMVRTMGIAGLLRESLDDEPMPLDARPIPFAGRGLPR